jgi:hypothetical protein
MESKKKKKKKERKKEGLGRVLTKGVPQDEGEIVPLFALLAEFQEGEFTGEGVQKVDDQVVYFFVLGLGCVLGMFCAGGRAVLGGHE